MKLFQRLLVAPAALGLMAPLAANADVTAISKDSDVNSEVIQARVDGVEAQLGEVMAGQFSSSTKMSGKAAFITGYVDDDAETDTDNITMEYMYQLNLNTSFTGEDNLYARIKSGNVSDHFKDKGQGTYLSATNSNADVLEVDKLWYQFPVGDTLQVWVGPKIENYYMLASAPSIYRPITKQFALGGNGSAYGSSTSPGFGVAWSQDVEDPSDPRFAISANYTSKDGTNDAVGMSHDDARSFFLTKLEYGSAQWQVSAAMANKTAPGGGANGAGYCNGYDAYFHTALVGDDGKTSTRTDTACTEGDLTAYGLRAYWKPDETGAIPSVQLGIDFGTYDEADSGEAEETEGWMVGLGWKDLFVDGNSAGFAYGSAMAATKVKGGGSDPEEGNSRWEAYYTFRVNDGVSVTPAVFGGSEIGSTSSNSYDVTGGVILTEFRF